MLFYLLLRWADSIKKTFPFLYPHESRPKILSTTTPFRTVYLFIDFYLAPLSSLTAGWKNGWQKSVREQIENKLPSHFLFLSTDAAAAAGSLHLVSIGYFPRV